MADDHTKVMAMGAKGGYRDESEHQVSLWSLFLAFQRLGLTAFGGPAMVAYIRDLAVGKKHWLSQECFADGTALCQSIPGATAMQTAAYVGLRVRGIAGALPIDGWHTGINRRCPVPTAYIDTCFWTTGRRFE